MPKNNILSSKVLLLYKKSAYDLYFLEHKTSLKIELSSFKAETKKFKKAHTEHYKSLKVIENSLSKYKINYDKRSRGKKLDYSKYKIIITVGGDGTFLEASRNIKNQILIGVNSAPGTSIGKLCTCQSAIELDIILSQMKDDTIKYMYVPRIKLTTTTSPETYTILNDLLICNKNPAAMSRYSIKIGGESEAQRSSGIWISTAIGSSGAIFSAGGKCLKPTDNTIQYLARELYLVKGEKCKLNSGVVKEKSEITIKSLMRNGKIFIDGAHKSTSFPFGSKARIGISPNPLKTIKPTNLY